MKSKFKAVFICVAFAFMMPACTTANQHESNDVKNKTQSFADGSVLNVTLADNDLKLVVANSPKAKAEGLSYKKEIPEDGMIFFFPELETLSFWMKDMNFPIDMIWIAEDRVVGIEKNVPAPEPGTKITDLKTYSPNEKADIVVEVEAGASDKLNIVPGSILQIKKINGE
ncbi:MAG: DUF192 domain-containing protein [Endomicrobia bacterium]|nr:DUF192 domain-containing protein [Endomicrobiia bacterium]